jgi:hypothetical protein
MAALFPADLALPTFDKLGARLAMPVDAPAVASTWFRAFSAALSARDAAAASALFASDSYWRDMLALTWDYRTFRAPDAIQTFLADRLAVVAPANLALDAAAPPVLERPYDDLAWVQLFFTFDSAVGPSSGIARLVPTAGGAWSAHTVYTVLEGLKGAPERTGTHRDPEPNHGLWVEKRRREVECEDEAPRAIVIGGGTCWLALLLCAASLMRPTTQASPASRSPRASSFRASSRSSSSARNVSATSGVAATRRSACTTRSGMTICHICRA